jgi:hypothetical protein
MTLADDLDGIEAMIACETSPEDVGRRVLIGLAKNSEGPTSWAARRLLGDCRQDIAPESSSPEAMLEFMPIVLPAPRGEVR